MPAQKKGQMTAYDGTELEVEHVKPLAEGGARFDVTVLDEGDGRRWRLDVERDGDFDVVSSWWHGELDDVPLPDWMDETVSRLAA